MKFDNLTQKFNSENIEKLEKTRKNIACGYLKKTKKTVTSICLMAEV